MLPDRTLDGNFEGTRGGLFLLALKTSLLTFLTLGIYRFWAKSRIRRYIWNATQPGGDPLEYTGTGLEKFLGFLIAIVVLAVYLGVIQLGLVTFGISFFDIFVEEPDEQLMMLQGALTLGAIVVLLPFVFYAQYRGRRYMLSRTRWRGIRFGMDQAAIGYMLRALGFSLLNLFTLFLLTPLGTYKLEKFKTDRTWYGTGYLQQGGRWTQLYRAFWPLPVGVAILVGGGAAMAQSPGLGITALVLGYIWLMVAIVHYRLQSFAIMARSKTLDGEVTFEAEPQTAAVVGTYIMGTLMTILVSIVAFIPAGVVFFLIGLMMGNTVGVAQGGMPIQAIISGAIGGIFYLLGLAVVVAAAMVYVTQPIYAHIVKSVSIRNPGALRDIRQRDGDEQADAEGFADALDVGGAF